MPRRPRIVVPGAPHHVTQRGNRRQQTFFTHWDYRYFLELLEGCCEKYEVALWAYCLMPNHVHLILVPEEAASLSQVVGETHKKYAARINQRHDWKGHLWQSRYASFAMDETWLLMAARYIELNPVRAKIVNKPEDYRWSSAGAHSNGSLDRLSSSDPLTELVPDWAAFLLDEPVEAVHPNMNKHEAAGYPVGSDVFIQKAELLTGRSLKALRRGRPPKKR
ncbi:MAG: transposase [Alphaproteobacteria bacterium]|nr:transposase [Alphaproteobacteria bacterium]